MNFTLAFILSLISAVGYSIISIFIGRVAKKNGSYWTSFWIQVLGLPLTALFIPFFGVNLSFNIYFLPIIVFSIGIFFTFIIYTKSLSIGPVPVVQAVLRLGSFITFILAILFLGETVNLTKIVAGILIILGVILVSFDLKILFKKKIKTLTKAIPYALLQAFINGIIFTLLAISIKHFDGFSANLAVRLIVVPLFLASSFTVRKPNKNFFKSSWRILLFIAAVDAVAFILFTVSIKLYQVSLVAMTQSTFPVITAILCAAFLHEHLIRSQKVGIVITFTGSFLLAFSG